MPSNTMQCSINSSSRTRYSPEILNNIQTESNSSNNTSLENMPGYLFSSEYDLEKYIGKYTVIRSLGNGSSGSVLLCENSETKTQSAIKIIKRKLTRNLKETKTEKQQALLADVRVYRETVISSLISHPNIVRLLDFLYSDDSFFLVFAFVRGEQLYDSVVRSGKIPEDRARRYFRQLVSALEYIHRNCIVHRDLKIENILVDENDNIQIIDFGLSNFYDTKRLLNTFCGSLYFAAPELLMSQHYQGPEVDVWSLGVILYVMLCGRVPFDDESVHNLQSKIRAGKFEIPSFLSSSASELVAGMIRANPTRRMKLAEVKKSGWINKGYEHGIHNYMHSRAPIHKLNMPAVRALSAALAFQFPNAKEELENYNEMCVQGFASIDQVYWTNRPVICLYHMLIEESTRRDENTLMEGIEWQNSETKRVCSDDIPGIIHAFVRFVFAGVSDEFYSRYFPRQIFCAMNANLISPNMRGEAPIIWPCIRKSYVKGFFKGIKARHIKTPNGLKKYMLEVFSKHNIVYEANEKSYYCTYDSDGEECYFKISMYINLFLSEYFVVLTCLNNKQSIFKIVNGIIRNELKDTQNK